MSETKFKLPVKPIVIVLIIVAAVVLFFGLSSFYVVAQQEEAVVLTLGRYTKTTGPGLHGKLPYPFQTVYRVPVREIQTQHFGFRVEEAGVVTTRSSQDFPQESIMLTGDLNIIDVEWIVQYRISNSRAWLFNVEDRERTVRDISISVMNQLVGDYSIFDILRTERATIEEQARELMMEYFDSYSTGDWGENGMGVNVVAVRIQNALPPSGPVADAFEDVNRAEQDMNRLINEGREAYYQEVPRAEGEADQIILQAEGYAQERINEADGDVARFISVYEEYRQNPSVTRARLYYEMIEDVFGDIEGTDLIDRNLQNFIPLRILTDELQGVIQ